MTEETPEQKKARYVLEKQRDREIIKILHDAAAKSRTQQATIILNLKENHVHLADGEIHRVCDYEEVAYNLVVEDKLKAVTLYTTQPTSGTVDVVFDPKVWKRFYYSPREKAGRVIETVRVD